MSKRSDLEDFILQFVEELYESVLENEYHRHQYDILLPVAVDAGVYISSSTDMYLFRFQNMAEKAANKQERLVVIDQLREQVLNANMSQLKRYHDWIVAFQAAQ